MEPDQIPKYWSNVEQNESLRVQLGFIPAGGTVLEIGPGSGNMTEALLKKGCEVTAIEADPDLAALARPFCKRLILADVESLIRQRESLDQRFDVILLGDVLEHLVNPEKLLRSLPNYLSQDGFLVVSVPNVAHASVRLSLLDGRFNGQKDGILDSTHLRFFTIHTMTALFYDAGYEIHDLTRIRKGFFETSIPLDPANIQVAVLKDLCRDPEAQTYQFVFRAAPRGKSVYGIFSDCSSSERPIGNRMRQRLSMEYIQLGRKALSRKPPDASLARRMYYRAFIVHPNPKSLIATAALLLPYRAVKIAYRIINPIYTRIRIGRNRLPHAGRS